MVVFPAAAASTVVELYTAGSRLLPVLLMAGTVVKTRVYDKVYESGGRRLHDMHVCVRVSTPTRRIKCVASYKCLACQCLVLLRIVILSNNFDPDDVRRGQF